MVEALPDPSFAATLPGAEYGDRSGDATTFMLAHRAAEPYSITIMFNDATQWQFDRSMLTEGMTRGVGHGHVRVFPLDSDIDLVGIATSNGEVNHVVVTKKDLVRYFLNAIEHFSPTDADHSQEIEDELRQMLG